MFDNHYRSLVYCNDIAYEDVVYKVDIYPDDKLMDRNVDNLMAVLWNTFLRILCIHYQPK